MRRSLVGATLGTLLVVCATADWVSSEPVSVGQGPITPYASRGALVAHVAASDAGPQAVTVIDPDRRVMAIYHVDRSTGEIALKSVRNLTWDLELLEFNSASPLPQDIRAMRGELQR